MVWFPALSITETVERVGAYAGIASFFGIALLAVLYFAQAREIKRLRDWAGRAPERAREHEQRVAEDSARRLEEQPAPAVTAAPAAAATTEPAVTESDAAPDSEDAAAPVSADAPVAADGAVVASPAGAVPAEQVTEVHDVAAAGSETPAPGEAVAAVPAAGTGAAPEAAVEPEAETTVDAGHSQPEDGPPTTVEPATASAAPRPATAAALRAGRPSTTLPHRPSPPPPAPAPARRQRRGLGSYALMGVLALLVLAIGAAVFSTLGGDDPATAPDEAQVQATATATATPTTDPAADRTETTVAVLNGTTTTGLAAELVEQLTQAGYQEGPRGNNADQQRQASVVLYRDGFDDAARDVSGILDISEVQPMDEQTAAQPIGDAQVVVIAGQDQAP